MKEFLQNKWVKRLLFPHWVIKLLLVIVVVPLLIYSLGFGHSQSIVAYVSYGLSAYTLTVVAIKTPVLIRWIRGGLHSNQYSNRYLSDPVLRAKISLYGSTGFNLLYALFYMGTGIFYRSAWMGAIAVYYIVLSLIRVGLVRRDRQCRLLKDETEKLRHELKSSLFCGWSLFLLNIAVVAMAVHMIWQNKYYAYPGFVIYAQAAYTFYHLTKAIINLIKYRKMGRPIIMASKVMSLACATMSIFALQTAMLMQFGDGNMDMVRLANILTGTAVCFIEFAMAVIMVVKHHKELNLLNEVETEQN